jgi:hypothetical protein
MWRVQIIESDRFRGQELLDTKLYKTEKEALAAAKKVNRKLTDDEVPECYIFARVDQIA